jgi:hypothetical protein
MAFYSGREYTITEQVPVGWVLENVECTSGTSINPASFDYIPGGVIITVPCSAAVCASWITCTFTNSPEEAVGGVVIPANTFAIVPPWLAVIGLVGCISTVAVISRKREP